MKRNVLFTAGATALAFFCCVASAANIRSHLGRCLKTDNTPCRNKDKTPETYCKKRQEIRSHPENNPWLYCGCSNKGKKGTFLAPGAPGVKDLEYLKDACYGKSEGETAPRRTLCEYQDEPNMNNPDGVSVYCVPNAGAIAKYQALLETDIAPAPPAPAPPVVPSPDASSETTVTASPMVPPPANPTTSPPTPPVAPVAPPTPPPTPASPPTPAPPTAIAPISMSCCHGNGEMPLCRQDGPDGKKSIKEGATEGICPSTSVKTGKPAKRLVHVILPTVDEQCAGDGVIPGVTHCGHIPAKQWTPSKFFQDTVLTPMPNPSNPIPPTPSAPSAPSAPRVTVLPPGGSSMKLRVPPLARSAAVTPPAPSGTLKKSKCGAETPGGRFKYRCQGGGGGQWRSTQCQNDDDVQWYICPSEPRGCTGVCFCKERGILDPGSKKKLPKSGYFQGDCRKIKVDLSTYFVNEKATGTFG